MPDDGETGDAASRRRWLAPLRSGHRRGANLVDHRSGDCSVAKETPPQPETGDAGKEGEEQGPRQAPHTPWCRRPAKSSVAAPVQRGVPSRRPCSLQGDSCSGLTTPGQTRDMAAFGHMATTPADPT